MTKAKREYRQGYGVGFYRLLFQVGKREDAKTWPGSADAKLTRPLNRYHCGMTVGHGAYQRYERTNPAGSACSVYAWFSDGRVNVNLPDGGCGLLGRADVEVVSWPDYVPSERIQEFNTLPAISLIDANGDLECHRKKVS